MDIKINKHLLSIPPYISTSWENIQSISMEGKKLQVILADGSIVEIPNLEQEVIDHVFSTHAEVLETEVQNADKAEFGAFNAQQFGEMGENLFQVGFAAVDELGSVMQHNESQSDAPDLPTYVIEKIGALAKAMAPEDVSVLPKAHPNCNCMHCQITRAILHELQPEAVEQKHTEEIEVTEEDLKFDQWIIAQTGDQMFTVTNKLDSHEHYNVHLGTPVGCTCGKPNCEHIVAVLKS